MFPIIPLIAAGAGIYQAINSSQKAKEQEALAQRALNNRQAYQPTEASRMLLADAMNQRNAANPAIILAQQQAQKQAAATSGMAQRYATSGAEALQASANAQAQLQNAQPQIMQAQAAYEANNRNNYYNALQGMGQQQEMVAQDRNNMYSDQFNWRLGRANAANYNASQGINLAAQGIMSAGTAMGTPNMNARQGTSAASPYLQPTTQTPYYVGSPQQQSQFAFGQQPQQGFNMNWNTGVYWPQ